ncbi:ankyrin [Piromyces finnis]|uniref:Ankyrin n=1 Tax=Piromyces finnis TaxID=1754191 RepID=A0A1Y1VK42_9FUNG|nr:ankyrin [Piromyces finnis]|eukprot:ORX57875.1 ankyrin [Piromyces finnis]
MEEISELFNYKLLKLIRKNEIELLRDYFYRKLNINKIISPVINNQHLLLRAISYKCLKTVLDFFIQLTTNYNFETTEGCTPLFCALEYDNFYVATVLLNKKLVDINCRNRFGENALMYLHRKDKITKNKKILTFLLKNGININYKNSKKESYLSYVVRFKNEDYIRTIFGHYMFDTNFIINLLILSKYKIKTSYSILKQMVDNEFSKVEIYDDLYFLAVEHNTAPVMKTLLEYDVHFNDKNCSNKLLILASLVKNLSIIDALVQNGVDINKRSKSFEEDSALMSACKVKSYGQYIPQITEQNRDDYIFAMTQYFVDHGAIINETNKFGYTPLIYASKYNNFKAMRYLVEHGADINAKNNFDYSPLLYFSQHDNLEGVYYLVEHGANIDDSERSGDTSLMIACKNNFDEIMKYLVEKNANINAKNSWGHTPLMYASEAGNLMTVQYLLNHGANINEKNNKGDTPVLLACKFNHFKVMEFLIINGANLHEIGQEGKSIIMYSAMKKDIRYLNTIFEAEIYQGQNQLMLEKYEQRNQSRIIKDINVTDQLGFTALMHAVINGNKENVKYLIDHGADVTIKNKRGQTAAFFAINSSNKEIVKLLIRSDHDLINNKDELGAKLLLFGVKKGNQDIVELLLELGANVNHTNSKGETALFHAIKICDDEIAIQLINKGANVNAQDINGDTPVMIAVRLDVFESCYMTKILIEHGADILMRNNNGETPLHMALRKPKTVVLRFLISHGADMNEENFAGETPLMYAIKIQNFEGFEILVDRGADINYRNAFGLSVFIYIIQLKIPEYLKIAFLKMLIRHGVEVNAQDYHGKSALFYAIKKNSPDLVQFLLEIDEVDINLTDRFNQTPLMVASKGNKNPEILKLLIAYGANPNIQDNNGKTSLIYLCGNKRYYQDPSIIEYIIDNGADPLIKDSQGKTPLIWASKCKKIKVVETLIHKGATVNDKDNFNHTALTYAIKHQYNDIVNILKTNGSQI